MLCESEVGVAAGDELSPATLALQVLIEQAIVAVSGLVRLLQEVHPRLFRRPAGLEVVAALTGRHDVLPVVPAAAMAGNNVIQSQVASGPAAILALELVAKEDVSPCEAPLRPWPADQVDEADDGRNLENRGDAVEVTAAVFDDLRFTAIDKYERPPNIADVQRFVILIED